MRGERVVGCVPQAAAPHAHVLIAQLPDADQDEDLVARDHQLFHPGLHNLTCGRQWCRR